MKNPIKWFKELFYIVKMHQKQHDLFIKAVTQVQDRQDETRRIAYATQALIKERTTVHMDISPSRHDLHQIITIGRYKGKDYVQIHTFNEDNFKTLVDIIRSHNYGAKIGRIDTPWGMDATFLRDVTDQK